MKYIIGNRNSGVSSDLILEASNYDTAIIARTNMNKDRIKKKCEDLGIKCPMVFSFNDILLNNIDYSKYKHFVIEDMDFMLKASLGELGFHGIIDTCGVSME